MAVDREVSLALGKEVASGVRGRPARVEGGYESLRLAHECDVMTSIRPRLSPVAEGEPVLESMRTTSQSCGRR